MMSIQFYLVAFFACLLCTMASPIAAENDTQKRGHSGQGTWFEVGLGNCGDTNKNSDMIVALPTANYDGGSNCGRKIKITSNGKTKMAIVKDSCPSCDSGDLDMSPSLFKHFASLGKGVISVKWEFV